MPKTSPIIDGMRQRTLRELERQVLGGKWPVGTRLPSERAMAEIFGASRTTVREAVQHLIARGLLEARQGSGVFVLDPASQPDPAIRAAAPWLAGMIDHPLLRNDILEFRLWFECGAARLAAERATRAQHASLGRVIGRMQDAVRTCDVDAEAQADAAFHELLADASHNLMIKHFYTSVISTLRLHITHNTYEASRRQDEQARRGREDRLAQHERIHHAIVDRLPDQAHTSMHEHIRYVGAQFIGC
jgi:GntR family transcriptional repressor for pyruvate dehydrogenase complex